MPDFRNYAVKVKKPGTTEAEATRVMDSLLKMLLSLMKRIKISG